MSRAAIPKRVARSVAGLILIVAANCGMAVAQTEVRIVALGASNTYGKGVAREEAYPAHLKRLLRAKGIDAVVINAGVNGNTTAQMLKRLDSAIRAGTRLVILQPGGNDSRRGSDGAPDGNIAAIRSGLAARGIAVVMLDNETIATIRRQSPAHDQGDGSHLTAKGYAALAAAILPEITSALGK